MLPFPIVRDETAPDVFPPLGSNPRVLLIWPRFPPSFWGFEGVLQMLPEAAMTPPLGLITVAALCPPSWSLRLLDRAFDEVTDSDFQWADLVMVSAMHAQRVDTQAVLSWARRFGKRTFIGGPWASSEPEKLQQLADHVLVGEAEEVFAGIAADLERGTARAVYRVAEKPDMSRSPIPRFDLLRREKYTSMPVQFSRGCPFQCEFCDIITIYGRKPRVKSTAQLISELDTLRNLGWRNEVFIVDDNFIGNSKNALQLARELAEWGNHNGRVFSFYTEASVDLADRPELMAAMVEANFMYVFLGIESPSAEALKSTKKFQNLRKDNLAQIRTIQANGLWVLGGFIVGFDSDDETIFERQRAFIEEAGIAWAMAGMLQAPPTTPLYDRMRKEGRLFEESEGTSNFSAPNFRTAMPLTTLMNGLSGLLGDLYAPDAYFERAFRSLELWKTQPMQKPPDLPFFYNLRLALQSMWTQGVRSTYRGAYWKFVWRMLRNFRKNPAKLWMGSMILLAGHHFLIYADEVARELASASSTPKGAAVPRPGIAAAVS